MNSNQSDPTPDLPPPSLPPSEILHAPGEGSRTRLAANNLFHAWLLLLVAGLLAGVVSAGLGETFHDYFLPERKPTDLQGNRMMEPTRETRIAATLKNGALDNAELGAVLGLALGLAGGLARRSVRATAVAATVGLVLGAVLGTVTPLGLFPLFYAAKQYTSTTEPDLLVSLLMHAGIWASLGAVGGLAFGIGLGGRGRLGRAVIGGFFGAFVATLLYEVLGAVLFPLAGTGEPIAETWEPRVLVRILIPVLCSLAIGKLALATSRSKP